MNAIDLFAGPGGWDEGVKALGIEPLGIEWDDAACATREAAGHRTLQADVAALDPLEFARVELLIASPPCTSFSYAGNGGGREEIDRLFSAVREVLGGGAVPEGGWLDETSRLVLEPARWIAALHPQLIACEQVPAVLPLWQRYAESLRADGYSAWAGILNAADYGVPQTRRRAFLIASQVEDIGPPPPTHSTSPQPALFGGTEPWVTMADALGWGATARPYPTIAGGTAGGPCYDFTGGSGARKVILAEREADRWTPRPWPWVFPATTVTGDPRITARCHHELGEQGRNAKSTDLVQDGDYEGTEPIRLTTAEAATLQGFRSDYPWQGNQKSQHNQIGNAVPPPLACAVVRDVLPR